MQEKGDSQNMILDLPQYMLVAEISLIIQLYWEAISQRWLVRDSLINVIGPYRETCLSLDGIRFRLDH